MADAIVELLNDDFLEGGRKKHPSALPRTADRGRRRCRRCRHRHFRPRPLTYFSAPQSPPSLARLLLWLRMGDAVLPTNAGGTTGPCRRLCRQRRPRPLTSFPAHGWAGRYREPPPTPLPPTTEASVAHLLSSSPVDAVIGAAAGVALQRLSWGTADRRQDDRTSPPPITQTSTACLLPRLPIAAVIGVAAGSASQRLRWGGSEVTAHCRRCRHRQHRPRPLISFTLPQPPPPSSARLLLALRSGYRRGCDTTDHRRQDDRPLPPTKKSYPADFLSRFSHRRRWYAATASDAQRLLWGGVVSPTAARRYGRLPSPRQHGPPTLTSLPAPKSPV